jgi:hypothetical protein
LHKLLAQESAEDFAAKMLKRLLVLQHLLQHQQLLLLHQVRHDLQLLQYLHFVEQQ